MRHAAPLLAAISLAACVSSPTSEAPRSAVTPVSVSASRMGDPNAIAWAPLDAAAFAKAKSEKRFVLLDGSAEWCHWCHVMDQTTYADPKVQRALRERFVTARVDIDSRPDIEERYASWGWPATIVFSPDGEELGKYKGYIAPDRFVTLLEEVAAAYDEAKSHPEGVPNPDELPLDPMVFGPGALDLAERYAEAELEGYWDPDQGGWGKPQKAPLWWNDAYALDRAATGDPVYLAHARLTLDGESLLIDPVWGGVSQYSTDGDWRHPHYEKLMYMNAGALDSYSRGYALTHDRKYKAAAEKVRAYLDRFLSSPEGGFYTSQDADLDAHALGRTPVLGGVYYAWNEAERLSRGVPRIDKHEYAREQGYAIAAYVSFAASTGDVTAIARAKLAAGRALATHEIGGTGSVTHEQGPRGKTLFLADQAALTWGIALLAAATKDAGLRVRARTLGDALVSRFYDERGGGFWGNTPDANAAGAFVRRRKPFEENALAVRALAALGAAGMGSSRDTLPMATTLRRLSEPLAIKARGRVLGEFLLAVRESRPLL